MPVYVDGSWRDIWGAYVKVDGVWRNVDVSAKADNDWKSSHINNISESDIVAFRMIYKLNPNKEHPLFPNLKTNLNMPVEFSLTGENIGMNYSTKGVLYHYERFGDEEGIMMYEGALYAVLKNGCIAKVSSCTNTKINNDDIRIPGPIPSIPEVWITSRLQSLDIRMEGYILFESFRYHLFGWNSLFDTEQFLLPEPYTKDKVYQDIKLISERILLPVENRLNTYDSIASIGITRSLTDIDNMIGAYGTLDHTINSIKVNGISKPFVIEIYN
jgi:hypothetical protein